MVVIMTTKEKVLATLAATGYSYVSGPIESYSGRVTYCCDKGHQHDMSVGNLLNGRGCPTCSQLKKNQDKRVNSSTIQDLLQAEGYRVVSSSCTNGKRTSLITECPNGHSWVVSWSNWKTGRRCPECKVGDARNLDLQEALEPIVAEGYIVLAGQEAYKDVRSYVTLQCPKLHSPYDVMVYNFRNGRRCPGCGCHSSGGERELVAFVQTLDPEALHNSRQLIEGKEVDVWSQKNQVAVEYHGLYWHSEALATFKGRNYHYDKMVAASTQGVKLFQFFEDEWKERQPQVKAIIQKALGASTLTKVGARECTLREVGLTERRFFLSENHLQGDTAARMTWGLEYEGRLVQVLSIRNNKFTGGKARWDIARLASDRDTLVVGGLSRLLSAATGWLKEQGANELYTFADRRYSQGQSYLSAGFEQLEASTPGYWYTDYKKRYHRFAFRKTAECPEGLTEVQWRATQGLYRIWDCGQLKFVKRF